MIYFKKSTYEMSGDDQSDNIDNTVQGIIPLNYPLDNKCCNNGKVFECVDILEINAFDFVFTSLNALVPSILWEGTNLLHHDSNDGLDITINDVTIKDSDLWGISHEFDKKLKRKWFKFDINTCDEHGFPILIECKFDGSYK